jgi:hypothetical protein
VLCVMPAAEALDLDRPLAAVEVDVEEEEAAVAAAGRAELERAGMPEDCCSASQASSKSKALAPLLGRPPEDTRRGLDVAAREAEAARACMLACCCGVDAAAALAPVRLEADRPPTLTACA